MKTKYIIAIAAAAGVACFFSSKRGKTAYSKMACNFTDMVNKAKDDLLKDVKNMASDTNSKIQKSL